MINPISFTCGVIVSISSTTRSITYGRDDPRLYHIRSVHMSYEPDAGFVIVNNTTEERTILDTIEEVADYFGTTAYGVENHMSHFPLMQYKNNCSIRRFDRVGESKGAVCIPSNSGTRRKKPAPALKWAKAWSTAKDGSSKEGLSSTKANITTKLDPEPRRKGGSAELLATLLNNLPSDTMVINGFSYHTVSLNGDVINHKTQRAMSRRLTKNGYIVGIKETNGKAGTYLLRRLIASNFIPNPEGLRHCVFANNDPGELSMEGARWISSKEYRAVYEKPAIPATTRSRGLGESAIRAILSSLPDGTARLPHTEHHTITKAGVVTNVRTGAVLKHAVTGNGYYYVSVTENGNQRPINIHRALAQCFVPNPFNHKKVIIKDGDKSNISLDNLVWSKSIKWYLDDRDGLRK